MKSGSNIKLSGILDESSEFGNKWLEVAGEILCGWIGEV